LADKMAQARAYLNQARTAFGVEPPDWQTHPVSWTVWMTQRITEVVPEICVSSLLSPQE
jgi:hypothetical protein